MRTMPTMRLLPVKLGMNYRIMKKMIKMDYWGKVMEYVDILNYLPMRGKVSSTRLIYVNNKVSIL